MKQRMLQKITNAINNTIQYFIQEIKTKVTVTKYLEVNPIEKISQNKRWTAKF